MFALIALGSLLKRFNFTNELFLKIADKLVYYIFFPALLFWKIGNAPTDLMSEAGFYQAVIYAVICVYILSTAFIIIFKVPDFQAGSFSQSCYRFNTYIGVAIIMNAFGEEGVRRFGILIGIIIPIINILAVSTLTWFSGETVSLRQRATQTMRALVTNPLILACLGGLLYSRLAGGFPVYVDNTLKLASYVTLPLALLSIGGALTFSGIKKHAKLSLIAAIFKLLILPVTGFMFLDFLQVTGMSFMVGMIFFSLPTSTALYVLSSQLNSDTELASAAIAVSTLLSFFTLSAALLIRT